MALQSIQDLNAPMGGLGSLATWQDAIGHIEAELYSSEIYQQMMVSLQARLGELAGETQNLIKHISREAIRLALQQLTSQSAKPAPASTEAAVSPHQPSSERQFEVSPVLDSPHAAGQAAGRGTSRQMKQKMLQEERVLQRRTYLQHLGQSFRQLRQEQGVTLDHLHAITRIPVHQLQALESGRVEALPESIYVRGFIRKIGNALGVEGDRLAMAVSDLTPQEGWLPSWGQPAPSAIYLQPAHLYVGYTALIAGAMGGLTWVSQQSMPTTPVPLDTPAAAPTQTQQKQARAGMANTQNIAPPEMTGPAAR